MYVLFFVVCGRIGPYTVYASSQKQDVTAAVEPYQEYSKRSHTSVEDSVVIHERQIFFEKSGESVPDDIYKQGTGDIPESMPLALVGRDAVVE